MTSKLITSIGYGRSVGLRVSSSDLPAVRAALPFWWRDEEVEPERTWQVSEASASDVVVRDIEFWVAEHAVDQVFVHAGVVAFGESALLLPGRSFTGKSTLVAALLRAGASYGSDEYAVIDDQGLVHPYPRPLSLREFDGSRRRVRPEEWGAQPFGRPIPVSTVASIRRVESAELNLGAISAAAAVLVLLDNTVAARTQSAAALTACAAASQGARLLSGVRDDADEAALALRNLITDR